MFVEDSRKEKLQQQRKKELKVEFFLFSGFESLFPLFTLYSKHGLSLHKIKKKTIYNPWPNLKNLSGGLNLSRGLNMVGPA